MSGPRFSRRDALRTASIGVLGSTAGCAGVLRTVSQSGQSDSAAGTPTTSGENQPTTTRAGAESTTTGSGGSETTIETHPGTRNLGSQPSLGADLESSNPVIVAYEDPSCPYCRKFEQETFPRIRTELLEPGKATFVYRGLGIVQEWGPAAAKALEATLERSEQAHGDLRAHYYDEQDTFDTTNVLSKTAAFLDSKTAVEGGAVVEDVKQGRADRPYRTDMNAASAAEITATPTFLLFRDGAFVSSAVGAVSYEVLATPLGL